MIMSEAEAPPLWYLFPTSTDMCILSNDIYEYHYVSQGKTTIPNVDDGEELQLTDVSESVNPVVTAQKRLILLMGRLIYLLIQKYWRQWPLYEP